MSHLQPEQNGGKTCSRQMFATRNVTDMPRMSGNKPKQAGSESELRFSSVLPQQLPGREERSKRGSRCVAGRARGRRPHPAAKGRRQAYPTAGLEQPGEEALKTKAKAQASQSTQYERTGTSWPCNSDCGWLSLAKLATFA